MNTQRLIQQPTAILVGMTQFNPEGFDRWLAETGLSEVAGDPTTPLGKIALQVADQTVNDGEYLPEFAGRFCYRSWSSGRETLPYYENILDEGHGSILEHVTLNFAVHGVSRSLTHELIRHRPGIGISQESQRYVPAGEMRFVVPPMLQLLWGDLNCQEAENWYWSRMDELEDYEAQREYIDDRLKERGLPARMRRKLANEAARGSLPNASETALVWSGNIRTLRHFLSVRGSLHADIEIRRMAGAVLTEAKKAFPILFNDIYFDELTDEHFGVPSITSEHPKV